MCKKLPHNFADPKSGAYTQRIERIRRSAKWRNEKHRGIARHFAESMLQCAVKAEARDRFETLLADIANFMPL